MANHIIYIKFVPLLDCFYFFYLSQGRVNCCHTDTISEKESQRVSRWKSICFAQRTSQIQFLISPCIAETDSRIQFSGSTGTGCCAGLECHKHSVKHLCDYTSAGSANGKACGSLLVPHPKEKHFMIHLYKMTNNISFLVTRRQCTHSGYSSKFINTKLQTIYCCLA